ncbi:HAD-IA family hydrolase [Oceanisphaera psychrotolerans]|uniref:HAD family hydrolase n=1 Tax=Oceanisphaera psychrotolerans TaxID=1414654 RepID=A0A1J4QJK2_9GAMM|nr:HAD-IA family hydrolase [Oceanisphaera psychrotolerans]OIN14276.1 HAD family hydrolase [Oceanisphaera psychrotolerans]
MRFYKRLTPVKVISFDLDDTLYDNVPVIAAAEAWLLDALKQHHPESTLLGKENLAAIKRRVLQEQPELSHDVSACRLRVLTEGLQQQGLDEARAAAMAEAFYRGFLEQRGKIRVPDATHRVLSALGQKYRLTVITNGNLPIESTELAPYFDIVLRAGTDGRMKPAPDMFHRLAEQTGVSLEEILHIGDHINTDVAGAVHSGCQAVWLNDNGRTEADLHCLPHVALERLEQMLELL